MQLHHLSASINICSFSASHFLSCSNPFFFHPHFFLLPFINPAIAPCTLAPLQQQVKCWGWERHTRAGTQSSSLGQELLARTGMPEAELLTAPTKSPKSNCQSPQIAWYVSRTLVQVLEAEEPDTQRELLFRGVSSNSDTVTVTSIKDSSELPLVPVQDTEKPECHGPLRLSSLPTSTACS